MAFYDDEPRDYHGRWTTGGDSGGSDAAGGSAGRIPAIVDPRVIPDTGDVWNRDTGTRLEKEYAAARPALHEIIANGIGKDGEAPAEVEEPVEPGWDALSGTDQSDAEEKYIDQNYSSQYDSEVESWQENGDAYHEAAQEVAQDDDWKAETITDFLADRKEEGLPDIPYTADDLSNAIKITAADDGYDKSDKPDPDIEFDDKHLQNPHGWSGASQMTLPGIEPEKPETKLTPEMREALSGYFIKQFHEAADKKADSIEPPDHLGESAKEYLAESWSSMDDDEKYNWVKHNTSLADDLEEGTSTGPVELAEPNKWDPMNETSGEDYKRTQTMAKYLADERAVELMKARGITVEKKSNHQFSHLTNETLQERITGIENNLKSGYSEAHQETEGAKKDMQAYKDELAYRQSSRTVPSLEDIRAVDNKLWSGWKGSSTGSEGQLLQVAAADELGGRLREAPPPKPDAVPLTAKEYLEFVGSKVSQDGTLDEFKKAIQSNKNPVSLAVHVTQDADMSEEQKKIAQDVIAEGRPSKDKEVPTLRTKGVDGEYDKKVLLPDLKLSRNGAQSFTTDLSVANAWGGTSNHVPSGIERNKIIADADDTYASIGGYAGVKAAVRAKWEATQYMLDKADMPTVNLYRGISYPHKREGYSEVGEFNPPSNGKVKLDSGMEAELKDPPVGAQLHIASGKTITKVSTEDNPNLPTSAPKGVGKWTYAEPSRTVGRVVMRAEVPRTAVLSVPAYGVNVHSEHEVVVTGTAWKHWDAFSDTAPKAERVPIGSQSWPTKPRSEFLGSDADYEKLYGKQA